MGYRIVKAYYIKLNKNHIPYFYASLVEGPNGGKYILDEFNSEMLVKYTLGNKYMSCIGRFDYKLDNLFKQYCMKYGTVQVLDKQLSLSKLGQLEKATGVLIRLKGRDKTESMAKNIEQLKEFVMEV